MDKEITFAYQGKPFRTVVKDGEILWCLNDVSGALGLTNAYRQAMATPKGLHTVRVLTSGGYQNTYYIDEPTLYRLIFKSRKEDAVLFQDWVFEVVLPSIRKTGKYQIPKEIRQESTEKRKELTDAWKESGISKRWEYGALTNQEYALLGFPEGTRKAQMDKDQVLLLMALETLEKVNLHFNRKKGYLECKNSLQTTARIVNSLTDASCKMQEASCKTQEVITGINSASSDKMSSINDKMSASST